MAELENANPIMDNPGENPINPEPEQTPDFSQLFSENVSDATPMQESEPAPTVEATAQQPVQEEPVTPSEPVSQPVQAPLQEEQAVNIQKELEHTSLDNHQATQSSQETTEAQKARVEQQKLAWLKEHEKKAKKSWMASWIFYGILLTLLLLVAGVIFAKDYVLNAIDYVESLVPASSLSLLNKNNNTVIENTEVNLPEIEETEVIEDENTEEVDQIQQYYDRIDDIVSSENEQENKAEQLRNLLTEIMHENEENEEVNEELTQYISQAIMDLTINSEETQDEENNENIDNSKEIDNSETYEEVSQENNEEPSQDTTQDSQVIEDEKWYTITHVDSEQEANWVIPSHCTDLTCYGEDEEFVACTSFKMVETLDENTPRVSSRWGCKYKDASELVYVEFSDTHNSADTAEDISTLTVSMTITPTTNTWWKEITFKSTVNNPDEIVDYEWDFGDWKSINSQFAAEVSHIYWQKWVYTVTLTVYDKNWNTSTTTESVTILEVDESTN